MTAEKPENGGGEPANIRVVDDSPANLHVLAGMLKDRGFKVHPSIGATTMAPANSDGNVLDLQRR